MTKGRFTKVYVHEAGGWWTPPPLDFDTPVGYTWDDKPIFEDRFGIFTLEEDDDEPSGAAKQSGEIDKGSGSASDKLEEDSS